MPTKFTPQVFLWLSFIWILSAETGCHSFSTTFSPTPNMLGDGREWRMYPVAADMNNDGHIDIVATHRRPLQNNSLHIWLGSGNKVFKDTEQNWNSSGYSGLAVHDINKDGCQDILAGSHFNRIHTYLSLPNKESPQCPLLFSENVLTTADGYTSANLVDIDANGGLEAVMLGNESAGIEIYKWDSENGWVLKSVFLENNIGRSLRVIDMNRDGRLDLVASMARLGIVILLQDDNGSFRSGPPTNFSSATGEFRSLDVADVNGDGWMDIVLNGGYAGMFKPNGPDVYLSKGAQGGWIPASEGLKVSRKPAEGIVAADFNGDGFFDVVAGVNMSEGMDELAYGLVFFKGDGKGNWQLIENSGLPQKGLSRTHGMTAQDMNKDGKLDLVATHGAPEEGSGYVSVWLNNS